ncbi:aspartate kinase [Sinimarinibacterium sp. CAU 1509]|uniref:aspartate kinase n=1 Tax=Sinimarinibacterium sp. CAU 1509 TaxID=2562283 RepID=UPI0010AC8D1C|nr:aspartate kinase [Sinimarinibacterium sp. CAU 1509]TJY56628.1 aspartate kinase [Sinimarinibacterium sp. CAU 1509]
MALIVQKYGGTSMGSVERIEHVARKVASWHGQGHQVVVVVSAMSGETDRLLKLAKSIDPRGSQREFDQIAATGEQVTIGLLALALGKVGVSARSYTGWQVPIRTDGSHMKARIQEIDAERLRSDCEAGIVPVVAGFQGICDDNSVTTLGRGGSDTTGVALAAALKADECQIYTDVDGVYTTDPRVEPKARRLDHITFEEMLELASLGSKVLQIRSVEFAGKYKVPLRVLSTFVDGPGTLITLEDNKMEEPLISGIAFNRDEAQITMSGVPDRPGIAAAILGPVGEANIEVDMIVQNVGGDGATDFTFTVHRNDYERTLEVMSRLGAELGAKGVASATDIVKVSLVGVGMRSHAGIASKMFKALAAAGINIRMISTSEIKISVVIEEMYLELAVRTLHKAFGLETAPAA